MGLNGIPGHTYTISVDKEMYKYKYINIDNFCLYFSASVETNLQGL